jgi:hypothetical protein
MWNKRWILIISLLFLVYFPTLHILLANRRMDDSTLRKPIVLNRRIIIAHI